MTDMIVNIMAEVLSILAIATKEAKLGRLSVSTSLTVYLHFLTDTLFRRVFQEVNWKQRH
jgi:hypothetical protein